MTTLRQDVEAQLAECQLKGTLHEQAPIMLHELVDRVEAAAALLRRLHTRTLEAEQALVASQSETARWKLQSDDWQARGWELGAEADRLQTALDTARTHALREAAKMVKTTRYKCEFYPVGRSRGVPMLAPTQFKEQAVEAILSLIPPPTPDQEA